MQTEIDTKLPAFGYECAYNDNYQGFEFIYLKFKDGKKLLILENRLAIEGIWLNNFQVVRMVKLFKKITFKNTGKEMISQCNEIVIESYKHRGFGEYDKNGMLKQTPDFYRTIKILDKIKLTNYQKLQIIQAINKVSKCHFFVTNIKLLKNKKLKKHFGFDDLGFAEFVMEIEKSFNITLPDDKLNHVKTLNDFLKLLKKEL